MDMMKMKLKSMMTMIIIIITRKKINYNNNNDIDIDNYDNGNNNDNDNNNNKYIIGLDGSYFTSLETPAGESSRLTASRKERHERWILNMPEEGDVINSSPPAQNGRHFGRRQFQMHFLEWKWRNSDSIFTDICSQESNWQ